MTTTWLDHPTEYGVVKGAEVRAAPIFDLLDVAATWTADQLGPCIGDDSETDDFANVSDLRLKEGISRIGTTVLGLPLYRFSYTGCEEVYAGVMAQDVLKVMPGAVSVGEDGFYRVNYGVLGISMQRLA
jgi:hypothetical protein